MSRARERLRDFLASNDGPFGRLGRDLRSRHNPPPPGAGRPSLFEVLPKESVGAEIGVHRGDFSAVVLAELRPKTLHLIDPWAFSGEAGGGKALYGRGWGRSQRNMDRRYQGVLDRFKNEIDRGTVQVHRCLSSEAAQRIPDGSLDWVYIDGDHSFDGVLADLRAFRPKLRPRGVLAGDDYDCPDLWWTDSVKRAVETFVAESDAEPVQLGADNQFVLRAPR